jgi:RIO-like serine/threonine protein kinase
MITIVYNDEQLRENKLLDWVYRIFRKIRHGRTFDVESFNIILDQNGKPLQFDFPNIYSGHNNKLDKDNIHCNKCKQSIKYYFIQNELLPVLFINTSNHSIAEIDNNCNKWKIEYRL